MDSWIAAKDAVDRGYTVDRRVGQAQCTRRIFRVTEPDNCGTSQGLRDAMELEGEEGESWKDQLQWVLNDDGQVRLLGAELALLPNQNSTLPIERSEETALNQLNAVGKMSHVHVTDEGYNNTGFAPGHSGDDPDHSSCPEEQAAQHGFPCLIDSVKEPENLPTYICII